MQEESEYGRRLRAKNIHVHGGRSAPRRREFRDEHDKRRREVTEVTDSGAVTTVTNRSDSAGDHQDVHVRAPLVTGTAAIR